MLARPDVYKRQIVKDEGDCRVVYNVDAFCYIFRQRSFLDRGRNKFLVSIVCDRYKAVSYTHLDVYKRQRYASIVSLMIISVAIRRG